MKAYALLLDDVMPELPGITPELATHHIKRAANDFYSRSTLSRLTLTPLDVVTNTSTYALVHPDVANFSISKVLQVEYEGRLLIPQTLEFLNGNPNEWDRNTCDATQYSWRTQTGRPRFFLQPSVDTLTLVPVPDHDTLATLTVTIADQPIYSGTGIGDVVFDNYAEDIGAGAKARLMAMPAKPWSNPSSAMMYRNQFESGVAAAHVIATRGFGRATLRTRAWG